MNESRMAIKSKIEIKGTNQMPIAHYYDLSFL
jgi:hypothetical protein